jgi:glutathione S-transferase
MPTPLVDRDGQPLELVLYKYDACPYCQRVLSALGRLGYDVAMRDTREDPGAQAELVELGGMSQVPMLLVNGAARYESAEIVRFLEDEVRRAPG